jgi:hypothetical protein
MSRMRMAITSADRLQWIGFELFQAMFAMISVHSMTCAHHGSFAMIHLSTTNHFGLESSTRK